MKKDRNNILFFFVFFLLSTLITWWFIKSSPLYISGEQMLLSCSIAGAKWMIQILAGLFILKEIKWKFLREIGFTCFIGASLLLPYCFSAFIIGFDQPYFFLTSLILSVLSMIFLYYRAVIRCGVSVKWWIGWLLCLGIAIGLQLTLVF